CAGGYRGALSAAAGLHPAHPARAHADGARIPAYRPRSAADREPDAPVRSGGGVMEAAAVLTSPLVGEVGKRPNLGVPKFGLSLATRHCRVACGARVRGCALSVASTPSPRSMLAHRVGPLPQGEREAAVNV